MEKSSEYHTGLSYGGGIVMRLRDGKKVGTLLLVALLLTGCGGAENTSDAVMSVSEDTAANMGACEHDL